MLNTNISFIKAKEYGFTIKEDKMIDTVTIISPFSREILTITGLKDGFLQVKFQRENVIIASRVDTEFESILGKNILRVDMNIAEPKDEKCICTIIESRENVNISMHTVLVMDDYNAYREKLAKHKHWI